MNSMIIKCIQLKLKLFSLFCVFQLNHRTKLCAVIYRSGGQNTRNNGQPHRTGGCFSCLGRKVRVVPNLCIKNQKTTTFVIFPA